MTSKNDKESSEIEIAQASFQERLGNLKNNPLINNPDNLIRMILAVLMVAASLFSFIGEGFLPPNSLKKFKENIPSLILGVLGAVVIVELRERLGSHKEMEKHLGGKIDDLERQHLTQIEKSLEIIKPDVRQISSLANLVHIIEGEDEAEETGLAGNWISLYQNKDNQREKIKWSAEIMQINEIGKILYIKTETDCDKKPMEGFGRVIQGKVLLGHWVAHYGLHLGHLSRKQGDFLLQIDNDGLMYGIYNAPMSDVNRFYKWILVKNRNDKNQEEELQNRNDKSQEELQKLFKKGWEFLQPLEEESSNFPALDKNNFSQMYDKLTQNSKKTVEETLEKSATLG